MKIFIEHFDGKVNEYEFLNKDYSRYAGYCNTFGTELKGVAYAAGLKLDELQSKSQSIVPFTTSEFNLDKSYYEVTTTISRIWFDEELINVEF